MIQDLIVGVTKSLMPSGWRRGDKSITSGTCDWIQGPGTITADERSPCLIIKNGKTVRIKIYRTIVTSSKFANGDKVFNNVWCNKDIL